MNKEMNKNKNSSLLSNILCGFALSASINQAYAGTYVTLYGRVEGEVSYQTNQATGRFDANGHPITGGQWSAPGNVWGTSFFGMKGAEDLGGGLKVIFNLESGFSTDSGEINGGVALWNRRSFVGLASDYGTIKFGSDCALPGDKMFELDPGGLQALGAATLNKGRVWPHTINQIQYASPEVGGFSAVGAYAFEAKSGSSGPDQKGRSKALELSYNKDGLLVRVMYDDAYDATGQLSSLFEFSRQLTAGATYVINDWKLYAGFQTQSAPDMLASYGNPDRAQTFWLGANYQVSPNLTLIPAVFHTNLNQGTGGASLYMLGANYYLSNDTILFASIGTVKNSPLSSFAIEVGTSAVGVNQSALYAGISKSF